MAPPSKVLKMAFSQICLLLILNIVNRVNSYSVFKQWDHSVDLDENFRLLWSIKEQDITFEVQVKTLGYIGFGFTRDGTIYGADVVVGWVDQAHAYFQVRFFLLIFYLGVGKGRES
jgi:hypothetical protein